MRNALGSDVLGTMGAVSDRFACRVTGESGSCGREVDSCSVELCRSLGAEGLLSLGRLVSSSGRNLGAKYSARSSLQSNGVVGFVVTGLVLGGVKAMFDGDRESDRVSGLLLGGVPDAGGVVVPLIVSLSRERVGLANGTAGCDLALVGPFFRLLFFAAPLVRKTFCLDPRRLKAEGAEFPLVLLLTGSFVIGNGFCFLRRRSSFSKSLNSFSFCTLKLAMSSSNCCRFWPSSAIISASDSHKSLAAGEGSEYFAILIWLVCLYIASSSSGRDWRWRS